MSTRLLFFLITAAVLCGSISIRAQVNQETGSVLVKGLRVLGPDKQKVLARKRFYLFSGGLKDNDALIKRIDAAQITSRDCYYSQLQPAASACFIKWLQDYSCESPFCRKVTTEDKQGITEFADAFNKGLTLYNRREDLALSWIVDNMPPSLVSGYYDMQKKNINAIIGGLKPLEDTMTTPGGAEATFVDIAVNDKPVTVLISNLIPVEAGKKSFVWACEMDVQKNKQAILLLVPDSSKKNCYFKARDLKACNTGTCDKK